MATEAQIKAGIDAADEFAMAIATTMKEPFLPQSVIEAKVKDAITEHPEIVRKGVISILTAAENAK